MSVIIGNARSDEHGRITGGEPGDQTGKEVCMQTWYRDSRGWRILRPRDPEAAKKIAWDMQAACDNDEIGYDQSDNQSLYWAAMPYGFDCSKVDTPCETDCSQLIRVCVNFAGIPAAYFYTGNEADVLLSTGAFLELTGSQYQYKSDYLRAGDIGITKTKGHTWAALTDGSKAYLWSSELTIAMQRSYGTPVDGEIWGQYLLNKRYLPNADSGWKWSLMPKGSALIRAMQEDLQSGGYYKDAIDGIAGKNFVKALQMFLNSLYPDDALTVDGVMGCQTVKRLCAYYGI